MVFASFKYWYLIIWPSYYNMQNFGQMSILLLFSILLFGYDYAFLMICILCHFRPTSMKFCMVDQKTFCQCFDWAWKSKVWCLSYIVDLLATISGKMGLATTPLRFRGLQTQLEFKKLAYWVDLFGSTVIRGDPPP